MENQIPKYISTKFFSKEPFETEGREGRNNDGRNLVENTWTTSASPKDELHRPFQEIISIIKSQNIFLQSFSKIIIKIFFYKVFLQRILQDRRSRRKEQRWIKLCRKHDGLRPRLRVRRTSDIDHSRNHFNEQIPKYISTKFF